MILYIHAFATKAKHEYLFANSGALISSGRPTERNHFSVSCLSIITIGLRDNRNLDHEKCGDILRSFILWDSASTMRSVVASIRYNSSYTYAIARVANAAGFYRIHGVLKDALVIQEESRRHNKFSRHWYVNSFLLVCNADVIRSVHWHRTILAEPLQSTSVISQQRCVNMLMISTSITM